MVRIVLGRILSGALRATASGSEYEGCVSSI